MIGALAVAIFFGITPPIASRATKIMGFVRANVVRLSIALVVLGSWAALFGPGIESQGEVFVLAGAIGFGIGGLAFLAALPRLGAPLTSLIEETISVPILLAIAVFYYSEGSYTTAQLAFSGVILVGIVIGLWPYVLKSGIRTRPSKQILVGVGLALLAALGQGISLAATRHGQQFLAKQIFLTTHLHARPDIITVAAYRLAGGVAVAVVVFLIARFVFQRKWGFTSAEGDCKPILPRGGGKLTSFALFWGGINALTGPILGVTCTVWAQQTYDAWIVQSIAALAPMIAVPVAYWLEGYKPPKLWYAGAVIAIAGVVLFWNALG